MPTDYRWLAESVVMASTVVARDIEALIRDAERIPRPSPVYIPGRIERLEQLRDAIEAAMAR